jgi:hypothetical protein
MATEHLDGVTPRRDEPGMLEVPAPAVMIAVSHIGVARRVLDGTDPREAFEASYDEFSRLLLPAWSGSGQRAVTGHRGNAVETWATVVFPRAAPSRAWVYDRYGGLAPRPGFGGKKWTTACFIRACTENTAALSWTLERYRERTGWPDAPAAILDGGDRARLTWLMDMTGIYASGGGGHDLGQCARIAIDRQAGKPRQRRAPVDTGWLSGEVNTALDAANAALSREAEEVR